MPPTLKQSVMATVDNPSDSSFFFSESVIKFSNDQGTIAEGGADTEWNWSSEERDLYNEAYSFKAHSMPPGQPYLTFTM